MVMKEIEEPNYGNWVSKKIIFSALILGLLFGLLGIWIHWLLLFCFLFCLISVYFIIARWFFSDNGKGIQKQVLTLIINHFTVSENGRILDVGCGNGPLSINLAKKYANALVTGVDSWGREWEYGQKICEKNALIEGVSNRTNFQHANAASLPFQDGEFDAVTSNLVFHEVREVKDKGKLIREALRVVKKGGFFTFQDLFCWKQVYGELDILLDSIKKCGVEELNFIDTSKSQFIPGFLKLPFMLGTIGIIYGKK